MKQPTGRGAGALESCSDLSLRRALLGDLGLGHGHFDFLGGAGVGGDRDLLAFVQVGELAFLAFDGDDGLGIGGDGDFLLVFALLGGVDDEVGAVNLDDRAFQGLGLLGGLGFVGGVYRGNHHDD